MAAVMLGLGTPQPGKNVRSHDGDSGSNCNTGKVLLRTRFSMRKAVPSDHDSDQTGGFGNRPGEQCL